MKIFDSKKAHKNLENYIWKQEMKKSTHVYAPDNV